MQKDDIQTVQNIIIWQTRWNRSTVGRATYDLVPNVGIKHEFPNQKCCAISYIRLLLDDSMLKAHQHKYRHEVNRVCDCGKGIEVVIHFLRQCSVYNNLRKVLDDTILKVWNETGIEHRLDITVQLILAPFTDNRLLYLTKNASGFCQLYTFDFIKNSTRCL